MALPHRLQAEPLTDTAKITGGGAIAAGLSKEGDIVQATDQAASFMNGVDGIINAAGIPHNVSEK